MKENGFTLIELLAVIIILAIIALIATPIVLNIIDDARKSAFERSVEGYYRAAQYVYDDMILKDKKEDVLFTFEDGKQTSNNDKYNLSLQGKTPKSGVVYISRSGDILVDVKNDQYCATKINNSIVQHYECFDTVFLEIPESCLYITENDLYDVNEIDINLPVGVETLGPYNTMFYSAGCVDTNIGSVHSIILPSTVDGIKADALYNFNMEYFSCSLYYSNLIVPSGIKYIGGNTFTGCWAYVENVILPDTLMYIGNGAFNTNQLTNITIPSSVVAIGNDAFLGSMFPDANSIKIEGDSTRFDARWDVIGFPAK